MQLIANAAAKANNGSSLATASRGLVG